MSTQFKFPEPVYVQLPNGDLWRGVNLERDERPDTQTIISQPDPLNDAMEKVMRTAKGGKQLTCLWCGQQTGDVKDMREHLKQHVKVNDKPSDAELAAYTAELLKQEQTEK